MKKIMGEKQFKRQILLLLFGCSLLLLNGCSDEQAESHTTIAGKQIVLSSEIDQVAVTRVNDGGFCHNDVMGVYVVDYQGKTPGELAETGNRANNVKFTFDEEAYRWNSPYDIYWKDNQTHIDVYGYYPFGAPANVKEYAFEVQKDQAREAANGLLGGYEASDFLWAKATDVAPTANIIRLSFKHKMANARITLLEGTGFADSEWSALDKQVLVLNTKRNAIINLSEGTIQATGEVASTGIIPIKQEKDFRAIVVPQSISASTPLFSITVGEASYKFTKNESFTYVGGKMHNFSIVVNKKANSGEYEFILANESITAWENDLVSHDATAREYVIIDVAEAGTLKEAIVADKKDYKQLQNLKITGEINAEDFYFMRDEMDRLQSLNLKEVKIKVRDEDWNKEDWIPQQAMTGKRTLLRLVLPDNLKGIDIHAFSYCGGLTGSLLIPEGVIEIRECAFYECKNFTGILSLPTTLKRINSQAFLTCKFNCELIFPSDLTHIGEGAFFQCTNLHGSLHLPDGLTYIGRQAFEHCVGLTGSLCIPQGVTEIAEATFRSSWGFDGTLTLHDGITVIGESAFQDTYFCGELVLPKNLSVMNGSTFSGCRYFSEELKLPDNLIIIGEWVFVDNSKMRGTLNIPESVQSIGSHAFARCYNLEKVVFPVGLESILSNAFMDCHSINSIICKAPVPPHVQTGAFDGIPKDNFPLEVPEHAIQQYQSAPGWRDFKRIVAHRELVCRPALATALNTQTTRQLILDAEGDWEVESIPDWCTLSATSGTKKTELTLTIHALNHGSSSRTDDIIFRLKDKDYNTRCTVTQYDYEYNEDQVITLQQATKGKGINLVFLGDGYNAENISNGEYMNAMREQVEHFFGIEPYATYRDYFNVYTAIALSAESGIGTVNTIRYTRFETTFTGNDGLRCNNQAVFDYALKIPAITQSNMNQSLIVITPNTTEYSGICHLWEDGSAIAICPMSTSAYPFDTRGVLQHEAGGHGFGKLADEYIYHNEFIDFCCSGSAQALRRGQSLGWYQNLSLTGKMHEVPWSHLIFHERYNNIVDVFEGGFMHSRGVFRSEQNSCMNNNIPYFSTISREAIVKRIMEYAGETYTFDKFLANDKLDVGAITRSVDEYKGKNPYGQQPGPYIHKGKYSSR